MHTCTVKHSFERATTGAAARLNLPEAEREQRSFSGRPRLGNSLHTRSSMGIPFVTYEVRVRRRCLVCNVEEEVVEPEHTEEIGPPCLACHAPTERTATLERRRSVRTINPHAAALGRLGGLKGGVARAAKLTPRRRRAIARAAARARWARRVPDDPET
jgi:hypothetical protein